MSQQRKDMLERMKKDSVVLEILRAVKKTGMDFY